MIQPAMEIIITVFAGIAGVQDHIPTVQQMQQKNGTGLTRKTTKRKG